MINLKTLFNRILFGQMLSFILPKTSICVALLLLSLCLIPSNVAFSQITTTNITWAEAYASLTTNRNRLLTEYAETHGYKSATRYWNSLSASQKGVFLTITDYLGRRSFAHTNLNRDYRYVGDQWDSAAGCPAMNTQSLNQTVYWIRPPSWAPVCLPVSPAECVNLNKCSVSDGARTDHDMVLNHVTRIYAINGSNGSNCGGMQSNRMYFQADEELIYLLRNIQFGLPDWTYTSDILGPHDPFTQSREGRVDEKPRGQTHFWAWDYQAIPLNRPGVYGISDPRIVEMDIDYNFVHDSNPECNYNNIYGRYFYQNSVYFRGLSGSAELEYVPSS